MGWMVRGSNLGRGKIFCTCLYWPWDQYSHLYDGYWLSFPGIRWLGHGIDYPPPSNARVKERVEVKSTPPLDLRGWLWSELNSYLCLYVYTCDGRCHQPESHILYMEFHCLMSDLVFDASWLHHASCDFPLTFWRRNYFFNFSTHCI